MLSDYNSHISQPSFLGNIWLGLMGTGIPQIWRTPHWPLLLEILYDCLQTSLDGQSRTACIKLRQNMKTAFVTILQPLLWGGLRALFASHSAACHQKCLCSKNHLTMHEWCNKGFTNFTDSRGYFPPPTSTSACLVSWTKCKAWCVILTFHFTSGQISKVDAASVANTELFHIGLKAK